MTVVAHGALGPADELVLVVPAIALLVLAVGALRRYNERRAEAVDDAVEPPPAA